MCLRSNCFVPYDTKFGIAKAGNSETGPVPLLSTGDVDVGARIYRDFWDYQMPFVNLTLSSIPCYSVRNI